jgi:hypothetical protein
MATLTSTEPALMAKDLTDKCESLMTPTTSALPSTSELAACEQEAHDCNERERDAASIAAVASLQRGGMVQRVARLDTLLQQSTLYSAFLHDKIAAARAVHKDGKPKRAKKDETATKTSAATTVTTPAKKNDDNKTTKVCSF